jgi:hypothetical protein
MNNHRGFLCLFSLWCDVNRFRAYVRGFLLVHLPPPPPPFLERKTISGRKVHRIAPLVNSTVEAKRRDFLARIATPLFTQLPAPARVDPELALISPID